MKKIFFLLTVCAVFVLCLCSCASLKNYEASDGGSVVYLRSSGEVSAVAENGYRFVCWSDGKTENNREYDRGAEEVVRAEFEPIKIVLCNDDEELTISLPELASADISELLPVLEGQSYRSSYASEEVCDLFGFDGGDDLLVQLRERYLGEGISEAEDMRLYARYLFYVAAQGGTVISTDEGFCAVSDDGYRFIGWSDDTESRERRDRFLPSDTSFEARFENVNVDMYADGELAYSIPVAEFVGMQEKDLFVSLRGKVFLGWEPYSSTLPLNKDRDIIEQIRALYDEGKIKDIENLSLTASFRDSDSKEFYAFRTIAHALGGAPWLETDNRYLNSLEVFEYHYDMGQRLFEIDLLLTVDGEVVAAHDYETTMTYREFMSKKCEGFTPIDLKMLIDLMIEHPDVKMDLDILSVYRSTYGGSTEEKLSLFYDLLDAELRRRDEMKAGVYEDVYERFILEIFPDSPTSSLTLEIAKREKYGFRHYLLLGVGDRETPMGTSIEDLEALCRWCVENGVKMMSTKILDKDFIAMTDRYDIFTFAYTFNSAEEIEELLAMGIDCVFTDFVYL